MTERVRLLVVGTGSIGERHVRCFQRTGRAELAICELDENVREAVAERYGVRRVYGDLEAAMSERFDAAVICTPAHLHLPMAQRLAEAGIHLLIEKPLSTTLDGTIELRRLVELHDVRAAVAYVYRAHPSLAGMREAIRAGRIGRPLQLVATVGQHFPTYRPAYREIYYRDRQTGGGAVQDALTHVVNAGEWLLGPIDRLVADAAHQALEGVEVEDTVHVLARHGSVLGCYSLNQHQAPNELTITVVGEQGSTRFEAHRTRWRWMSEPGGQWHDEVVQDWQRDSQFLAQAEQFLDSLAGTSPPLCSLAEAEQTLRVNLGILASVASGHWEFTSAATA